jgi:hypothetical protein
MFVSANQIVLCIRCAMTDPDAHCRGKVVGNNLGANFRKESFLEANCKTKKTFRGE